MSYLSAKDLDFDSIPIIDVSSLEEDDDRALRDVADQIRAACTQVGFFHVRNHGVVESVVDKASETAKQFFALLLDDKQRVAVNQLNRAFMKIGIAKMTGATNPDQKELFTIGLELDEEDTEVKAGVPLRGPNNWPSYMPQMQEHFYRYYLQVVECSRRLLKAVSVSLDLNESFFDSKDTKPMARSQLIYYPPQPPELGS
jgi:isopenicillin N synthase-like dioxygenase